MTKSQQANYFLLFGLISSLIIVYLIVQPFLSALILAAVVAFLFQPIYQRLLRVLNQRESLTALLTTIIAIVLVLLPVILLGIQIFKESSHLYQSLFSENGNSFIGLIENFINQLRLILPIPNDFKFNFNQYTQQALEVLVQNLGVIFSSFTKILLNLFVFLSAFYFFLKDGYKLKNYFVILSPLADENDEIIISRLKLAVSVTIKGSLAIGLIQGSLTGLGFLIFGVPNATLWGGATVLATFIPGLGTSLIIMPAIIFLFLTGNTVGGLGLLIWGLTAVGLIDNFLGPKLVGRGMQLHPLAVFLAVLGGLAFLGPLGFLLGPLTMSICLALIDIYFSLKNKTDKLDTNKTLSS